MTAEIKKRMKDAGWSVVKTAALSAAITAGVSSAFPAIGFTTNGIVASSVASIYQRNYLRGHIIGISPFSLAKKAGVKGLTVATKVGITAACVATKGICCVCKTLWNKASRKKELPEKSQELEENEKCNSDDEQEEEMHTTEEICILNNSIDTEWVNISYSEDLIVLKE